VSFHHHILKNGLQLIGEISPSARSVALGFFVRTGARDEPPEMAGVSHFLEHMVFKGTPHRSAFDVNRDFDSIGADYNAFTSEENTVFHAAILPEYLPQAVDILTDILRPSLRQDDFDMEKKVIIEEIGMYEDQPMSTAFDQVRKLYFGPHPLGNTILGTKESVGGLAREQMQQYFRRRYVATNVTVAAAGNYPWEQLVELVEKHCGGWEAGPVGRDAVREASGTGAFQVVSKEQVTQEHVIVMTPGPAANSPLRHAATTLALAVGDDSGSRLYWALVDPGLVDSADTSFQDYEGTGSYYTSFSCEPEQTQENLGIVFGVLGAVQREGITAEELHQAKSKILSRLVRAGERPKGRMRALGMDWIYLHEYWTVDDEVRAYDAVTLDSIRAVLDRYPLDGATTLALGPLQKLKPVEANGKPARRR
jgi:predicted Zn-dependent peptidase